MAVPQKDAAIHCVTVDYLRLHHNEVNWNDEISFVILVHYGADVSVVPQKFKVFGLRRLGSRSVADPVETASFPADTAESKRGAIRPCQWDFPP